MGEAEGEDNPAKGCEELAAVERGAELFGKV